MISYIKGKVSHVLENCIIIDNNNIGYQVFVSKGTLSKLTPDEITTVFTYMSVKEDGITLFGFMLMEELQMFNMLTTVSGVGPKAALSILDCDSPSNIALAILTDDITALSKAQGVGKKIAQRIVLELKDKMKLNDVYTSTAKEDLTSISLSNTRQEATEALVSLGYGRSDAVKAVMGVSDDNASTEQILKIALKQLAVR